MSIYSYLSYVKLAMKRRLRRLKEIMETENLSALLLFEGDPIAYKIALTHHFNSVLVLPDSIYVFIDPTLYLEALNESPWNVVLVENFTLGELAKKMLGLLREHCKRQKPVIGINKMWGRTRLSFLYADLLEALHSKGIEVIDATNLLTIVFDKPFEEELPIIKWISNVASQTRTLSMKTDTSTARFITLSYLLSLRNSSNTSSLTFSEYFSSILSIPLDTLTFLEPNNFSTAFLDMRSLTTSVMIPYHSYTIAY